MKFTYTDEIMAALMLLRDAGFALCAFDPEELSGVHPLLVEFKMERAGLDVIDSRTADEEEEQDA
jgi:hypothetical protein